MVMEFPDNVLNLDGHQNNSAQLKQFIQVNHEDFNCLPVKTKICASDFTVCDYLTDF